MDKLYLESGFLNFDYIINHTKSPFIFIIGGRGTGKTYGAIKWLIENREKAIFMRRTQEEADSVLNNISLSTAGQVFNDLGLEMDIMKLSKKNSITSYLSEDARVPVYISCSLSGAASIRGFSAEDVNYIIYDEFIKEKHKAKIKGEGRALFNAYETFNRNRELAGAEPIRLICMSNSDDVFNPIFEEFKILDIAYKMQKAGKHEFISELITIYNLANSPISEAKKNTVLYRVGNIDFNDMALNNIFETEDKLIKSINIKGLQPIASYGDFTIYNGRGFFYFTPNKADLAQHLRFERTTKGKKGLLNYYPVLTYAYIHNLIICENINALAAMRELFI